MANINNPWNNSNQVIKNFDNDFNKKQQPKSSANSDSNGHGSRSNLHSNTRANNGNDNKKPTRREEKPEFEDEIETRSASLVSKTAKPTGNDVTVRVISNFIPVHTQREFVVKQFHVNFLTPIEETNRRLKFEILRQFGNRINFDYFDGGNQLISIIGFDDQTLEAFIDGKIYQVQFTFIQNISSLSANFNAVINIMIRRVISRSMKLNLMGRGYFDMNRLVNVDRGRISIAPGLQINIRKYEDNLLACINLQNKLIKTETALDFMKNPRNRKEDIIGEIVMTKYNNKTYRVSAIENGNPNSTFELRNGDITTFADYYLKQYKISIRDKTQPLLIAKTTAKSIRGNGKRMKVTLIPELCQLTGLNDRERRDFNLMRMVSEVTRKSPTEYLGRVREIARDVTNFSASDFSQKGMAIENKLVEIDARELNDFIQVRNKKTRQIINAPIIDGDWSQTLKSNAFYRAESLNNWYFVFPSSMKSSVTSFISNFQRVAEGFGMRFEAPRMKAIDNFTYQTIQRELSQILSQNPKFIMFGVLDKRDSLIYQKIKKSTIGMGDINVPTQVITRNVIEKNGLSFASKIAVQVNSKIGGVPWLIDMKLDGLLVIGIDIAKQKGKTETYSAMSALLISKGNEPGSYFSMSTKHQDVSYVPSAMKAYFMSALNHYHKTVGSLPTRILVYRDGVNDGDVSIEFYFLF
jgi:aubergine